MGTSAREASLTAFAVDLGAIQLWNICTLQPKWNTTKNITKKYCFFSKSKRGSKLRRKYHVFRNERFKDPFFNDSKYGNYYQISLLSLLLSSTSIPIIGTWVLKYSCTQILRNRRFAALFVAEYRRFCHGIAEYRRYLLRRSSLLSNFGHQSTTNISRTSPHFPVSTSTEVPTL